MKAYRLATGAKIELFGDPVGEALIQNKTLREHQRIAVERAGCELVDVESEEDIRPVEPCLSFHDDLYLSWGILEDFRQQAEQTPAAPRILALSRNRLTEDLAVTQDAQLTAAHLLYPVYYRVPGVSAAPEPLVIDVQDGLPLRRKLPTHVYAEGEMTTYLTGKSILQIITPVHLHMANMVSILNRCAGWKPKGLFGLLIRLGARLARKRGPEAQKQDEPPKAPPRAFYKYLKRMNQIGKNCDIHPSAIIEGSVIGDNVRIGANCYLQFCNIGDNVDIGPECTLLSSIIGHDTRLVTREWVSMSVVYPNCFFAPRYIQFGIVGRDAQVFPSMYYDYRLDGKPIQTYFRGKLLGSRSFFLGPVIGHRARVAGGLTVVAGRMIPNGVHVYPNEATLVSRVPLDLPEGAIIHAGDTLPARHPHQAGLAPRPGIARSS